MKNNNQKTAKAVANDILNIINKSNDKNTMIENIKQMLLSKHDISIASPLENYSWTEIKKIADDGEADKLFNIGDTKTIELYTGEIVEAVIVGFNHDPISGESVNNNAYKSAISFGLKNLIDGEFEMNETDTNDGGWSKCKMRNTYMPRLFKLLPPDLQTIIETVDKYTGKGGGSIEIETTQDKLWLFSQQEIFGNSRYTTDGEGEQYPYFESENNCTKNRAGSACDWWLRSPYTSSTTSFRYINSYGNVTSTSAGTSYGVCFGFCI